MSEKDYLEQRRWVETNPGLPPELRDYFQKLNARLTANDIWPTTTTSTTTTTTSSSSTTTSSSTSSSTTTTSSSTTTTTA